MWFQAGQVSGLSVARWNCDRRDFNMRLKGNMVVELTDVNTSEVETVTEENMVTNAVNNILGLNPMGIFYAASGQYDDAV